MTDRLEEFRYLWDGSEEGWVVLRGGDSADGIGSPFNKIRMVMEIIEADELNARVCQRMIEEGCEVLDDDEVPEGTEATAVVVTR